MISIIICSRNRELRHRIQKNIKNTIGCDYEVLIKDNAFIQRGICSIYNELAGTAKGDYLCFVHEDVLFETQNWGMLLQEKAKDEKTGVIGFAGACNVNGLPYWYSNEKFYYYKQYKSDNIIFYDYTADKKIVRDNINVTVIDGMLLFCRKDVWLKIKFDERIFNGFHLYDIDFTFASAQYYKNFVNTQVIISHYSLGSVTKAYYESLLLFYKKWKGQLCVNKMSYLNKKHLIALAVVNMYKGKIAPSFIIYYLRNIDLLNNIYLYIYALMGIMKQMLKK